MRRKAIVLPCLLLIVGALIVVTLGCRQGARRAAGDAGGRVRVSVSLPVVAYFVDRIGGESVEVGTLVPQTASHDTYTPRPSQMASLGESSAYFALGPLDFETTWRERLTSASPGMKWVRLDEGVALQREDGEGHSEGHGEGHDDGHGEEHGEMDPHYWMSPRRAVVMCRNISAGLKELLPESAARIDSAEAVVESEVSSYDARLRALSDSSATKAFMIYHPALGYLAADYGFRQIAIEHEGSSPSARTYMGQTKEARALGVRVVFVQQGYDPERAEAAAAELGAEIVRLNPEGYEWQATMSTILEALR